MDIPRAGVAAPPRGAAWIFRGRVDGDDARFLAGGGGRGDSFAGALCAAYLAGASPAASLALANATGAATAGSKGAGRNVGRRDAVERLLTARAAGKDGAQAEDREAAKAALALLAASEPAAAAVGSVA